jgi:hypothetical protein
MPYLYALSDAPSYRGCLPATGDVHVKNGISLLIGKERSSSRDLMNALKDVLHGHDRVFSALVRTNDQLTPLISPPDDDQGSCFDSVLAGKLFDPVVNDLSVFKTDDECTSLFCL